MKIIKPYHVIETNIDGNDILRHIERAGRTCYKSEKRITADSAKTFVAGLIKSGHESVIEHYNITVRFICDRGVSHELVRHRLASFSQESTRYCNYGKSDEITVIKPCFWAEDNFAYMAWKNSCEQAERAYLDMLFASNSPQEARSVLPNSLKTEVVVTANLREWRTIFKQRTTKAAHPQMRELMIPLLAELKELIPAVFDDIEVNE
ncbi:Flavin-dependent thymidylate synthase [bioreactor metagenome]|uniref:Flavin-dependent thymidylate synthase n=1 Tax=bioreactor metagenome TaxID=1076179 RepID=A0A644WX64_9ZZZZ